MDSGLPGPTSFNRKYALIGGRLGRIAHVLDPPELELALGDDGIDTVTSGVTVRPDCSLE